MPYRVVYGETMPAWEKIVPTTRAADRFKRQREHVGDVVFSIARMSLRASRRSQYWLRSKRRARTGAKPNGRVAKAAHGQ